jgi:hypothetical protein
LSGLKPFEDIDIVFTGVRPGEKLYEELEITEEHMTRTRHPKIYIGKIASYPREQVQSALERLATGVAAGDESELRNFFTGFLPESQLEEEGKRLSAARQQGIHVDSRRPLSRIESLMAFGLGPGKTVSVDAIERSGD